MSDIASLGIKVESNLKTLNKDMEKTISLSEKVTSATEKMKAQMAGVSSTTKNVITEEVKRQRSVDNLIKSLTMQEIRLKEGKIGLDNYKASILGATEAEKKQIAALNTSIKAMQDANAAAKKHDSVLGSLITRLSALGAAYFGLQAIKEFTKDVVLLSARYETLGVVVENVGKTAGYSMLEINEQSKALQKQGISMIQSRESITKLIQAHIDLANAQKLGRIAQDAAVIGNVNSSHALERIVYGIQTAQIEVLKSVGLNVNFENSYKKLSIQLGKSTTDLTESEKTQARLNVVLERGADISGTYEAAMTTAGKQITSFTRYLEDFKVIFGQAFNDATAKIVSDLTIYMKEFTGTIGSSETQSGLKQFADGLGVILTTFISLGKAAIEVTKYIGEIGNLSKNLSIEQKGIELVNKGLIDQVKYTKATWGEKKKLIAESEPITKITKNIGEQTEGYNLYSESVKNSSKALRDAKKEEQDLLDKSLLDQKKARSEAEKAAKKAESEEKARQSRVDSIINKMKEQIATYKQATEVSAEYQLKQEGASPAEIKLAKELANTIDALKAKTKAQEAYNKIMDKTSSDPIELNREKSIEAVNQAVKDGAVLNVSYAESLAQINKHFDKMDMENSDKALKEMGNELDKLTKFDGSSFGNTIADGINNAMISMNKLNDTFDNNAKAQALIIKLQKEISTGKGSPEERKEKLEQIDKAESKMIENQMSGYRQLFGTTSQLFKENSKEREALHNIEMAFAAAEIAMNLQKTISAAYTAIMVQGTGDPYSAFARIAAMTALAGGIVAAAGGSLSGGGSASAPSIAPTAPQSTVLGSTEQSQSISSSFEFLQDIESGQYNELKDISSSMKDLNKNITGLVTSIVRTGGVSDFAGAAGTIGGTSVLQDSAIRLLVSGSLGIAGDAINQLTNNNKILTAIINPFIAIGNGLSDMLSGVVSNISGAVFGGSKKTSILASGLQITPGSIGSGDVSTQAFADIKVKKEGGLFGSDKTYFKTLTEDVDQSVSDMMSKVFKNMGQTMVDIAKGLGTDNLEEVFNYVFDIGKIDLKGLDTEGINKAITEALSTASDSAATTLFGDLIGQYQQIGEGILDTAVRLISDKAIVADVLKMTGQGFADSNIPAKALEVSESLIELAGGLDNLIDSSAAYYDKFFYDSEKQERLYGQLTEGFASLNLELPKTRDGYRDLVEAQNLNTESERRNYVALLGLAEGSDKYYTTLEEGSKATKDAIQAEIDLSNTRKEAVKKAERSLTVDLLTAQGRTGEALALSRKIELESMDELLRPMKLRIWALQDEAKNTELANKKLEEEKKAAQDAQKALEDLAKARKSELETLIKNTVQAQIDGYQTVADAANEALSKAEGLLTRSFEAEKSRLTAAHEQILKSLTKNVEDAQVVVDNLKSTFDSLGAAKKAMVLSGTSQISYKMAQDQLFSAVGMARQGDFSGASAVAADTNALTQDTMGFYSSFEDYQREFFKTKNAITELESLTGNELSVQETMVAILQNQLVLETASFDAQIKKLDDQLDGILGVDKSVINLTDAITQYQDAQNATDGANENLKKQTAILNNMMTTLFKTGVITGNLYSLVDEYTHPEKYSAPTKITTVPTADEQKTTNEDLIRQVKILTDTVERGNYAIAKNTQATAKTVDKIYVDGAGAI